jgi:transketolase
MLAAELGPARAVIVATGSEVALAIGVRAALADRACRRGSYRCRAPAFSPAGRRVPRERLPPGVPRVAVEAGSTDGWRKYVGASDDPRAAVVGLDTFGESAPAGALFKHFGITVQNVAAAVKRVAAAA